MITSKQTDELNVIRGEQLIITEDDDVIQDGEKMLAEQHFSLEELSREIVSVREGLDDMSEKSEIPK